MSQENQAESNMKNSYENFIEKSNVSVKLLEREPFLERFYSKVLLSPDRVNKKQHKNLTEQVVK